MFGFFMILIKITSITLLVHIYLFEIIMAHFMTIAVFIK
jgi:hypothetical protein